MAAPDAPSIRAIEGATRLEFVGACEPTSWGCTGAGSATARSPFEIEEVAKDASFSATWTDSAGASLDIAARVLYGEKILFEDRSETGLRDRPLGDLLPGDYVVEFAARGSVISANDRDIAWNITYASVSP